MGKKKKKERGSEAMDQVRARGRCGDGRERRVEIVNRCATRKMQDVLNVEDATSRG